MRLDWIAELGLRMREKAADGWEWGPVLLGIAPYNIPRLSLVVAEGIHLFNNSELIYHAGITCFQVLVGFTLGCLMGAVIGYLLGMSPTTEVVLSPYILALQIAPKVAFAPLFLLWFGYTLYPTILVAILIEVAEVGALRPVDGGQFLFFEFANNKVVGLSANGRVQIGDYQCCDALVLPSTEESWGLVVNEAMACGIPAIVSEHVGCVPDLIDDRLTGFSFPAGDVAALKDRMLRIIALQDNERARVESALSRKTDQFSMSCATNGLLEAIQESKAARFIGSPAVADCK